jgi:hypothetical protein
MPAMKTGHIGISLSLILLGALASFTAPPAKAQNGDALRAIFKNFLAEEGFRPEVDDDGDVVFKREGRVFFIDVHEDDPEFFMIALPNIWPIESAEERIQVLSAAAHTNENEKAAKVFTKKDDVWITIEMFVNDPEDFKTVFDRSLEAIDSAVDTFVARMKK